MALIGFSIPDDDPLVVVTVDPLVHEWGGRILDWVRRGPSGCPAARAWFPTADRSEAFLRALAAMAQGGR